LEKGFRKARRGDYAEITKVERERLSRLNQGASLRK
jgi:hypothetical protein